MLEFYWAYADYKDLMKLTEELFSFLLEKLFKKEKISYQGKEINFKKPWLRIEFSELFKKHTGIDLEGVHLNVLKKEAEKIGLSPKGGKFEVADEIYKKTCLPKIIQPTFVIHYPSSAFPLAKPLEKDPEKSGSFQLIVAGMETVKAFSELNDPVLQKKRFKEQEKIFKQGFEEAQRMDKDFIEALEYGMPPAAGFGLGIDRLVALLTDSRSLREAILFPTMKPKQ
jgi:lysyl-tRNA synthetase, class II